MSETVDWTEVGRVIGAGFGIVFLILMGLSLLLRLSGIAIQRVERELKLREGKTIRQK